MPGTKKPGHLKGGHRCLAFGCVSPPDTADIKVIRLYRGTTILFMRNIEYPNGSRSSSELPYTGAGFERISA